MFIYQHHGLHFRAAKSLKIFVVNHHPYGLHGGFPRSTDDPPVHQDFLPRGGFCFRTDVYFGRKLSRHWADIFEGKDGIFPSGYVKIAIENGHRIVDFPMKNCDLSIAMLLYQRVVLWVYDCFFIFWRLLIMAIGFESPEKGPFDQQTYGFAHGSLTERRNVTILE